MTSKPRADSAILDECLEAIQANRATVEQCLEKYPTLSAELQELLVLAVEFGAAHDIEDPDPLFVSRLKQILAPEVESVDAFAGSKPAKTPFRVRPWQFGFAVAAVLMLFVLLAGSSGVVVASAAALPGDRLYPVKRGLETFQLAVIFDPEDEARFLIELAGERQSEIQTLLDEERIEDLPTALESFNDVVDQGLALTEEQPSAELTASLADFSEQVAQSLATLERVHEKVPPRAQEAIQQAIENAEQRGPRNDQPSSDPRGTSEEERPGDDVEAERTAKTADQIARKYETTTEEVLDVYSTECDQDWPCVRRYFRELERGERKNQGQGPP